MSARTGAATVLVDTPAQLARCVRATVATNALCAVGKGSFMMLRAALGGDDRAMRWLVSLATRINQPILLNFPEDGFRSKTLAIGPSAWTQEKVNGWVGGKHEELAAAFGEISSWRTAS